jgi:hypothetical protein
VVTPQLHYIYIDVDADVDADVEADVEEGEDDPYVCLSYYG